MANIGQYRSLVINTDINHWDRLAKPHANPGSVQDQGGGRVHFDLLCSEKQAHCNVYMRILPLGSSQAHKVSEDMGGTGWKCHQQVL